MGVANIKRQGLLALGAITFGGTCTGTHCTRFAGHLKLVANTAKWATTAAAAATATATTATVAALY